MEVKIDEYDTHQRRRNAKTAATELSLGRDLAVFTRSAITPPKVNRFGWNPEHTEYIVGSWTWQILGAMRAVATVWEAGEIFSSGK